MAAQPRTCTKAAAPAEGRAPACTRALMWRSGDEASCACRGLGTRPVVVGVCGEGTSVSHQPLKSFACVPFLRPPRG